MIIYKAENKISGKVYIGQTAFTLEVRKYKHETVGDTGYYFHNAIRKHGKDNFEWKILYNCESEDELYEKEKYYINKYKSNIKKYGYNLTVGGEGPLGRKHTEEAKRKMSIAKTGRKFPHSKEWDKKIGLAQMGEKNHMYGKFGSLHHNSKKYIITAPNGEEFIIHGLNKFCRDNNLDASNLHACMAGKQKIHKGYKCKRFVEGS